MKEASIIEVKNISKSYPKKGSSEAFWALQDISFSLKEGEILGIIGRNGAGKSTLLKILGEIIAPTSGTAQYKGVITSILNIGTGFHPDLSGYDNIFFNASLLGLTKGQIKERVEEIIDFSGIRSFIHEPIKNYSSGMYLRLAFSIAIHVNAKILLLDEVVAVGDNEFKDKCSSKLRELAKDGTTILLVTHNMSQLLEFCTRCIWLEDGKLRYDGLPIDAAEKYIEGFSNEKDFGSPDNNQFFTKDLQINVNDFVVLEKLSIAADNSACKWPLYTKHPVRITLCCDKLVDNASLEIAIYLSNLDGIRIFLDSYGLRNDYDTAQLKDKGKYEIHCIIPADLLARGVYHLSVMVSKSLEIEKDLENLASFKVLPSTTANGMDQHLDNLNTVIAPKLGWEIKKAD